MSPPSPLVKPILGRIPLIGPLLKSNSRLKMFTPQEKIALDRQYRDALGLGDEVKFSDGALDAFEQGSMRDIKQFDKTKTPDGKTLLKKLDAKFENGNQNIVDEHTNNVALVKRTINSILEPTPEFTEAQEIYKDSVATFKDLVKKVPQKIRAEALIGLMTEIKADAIKAIEAQHKKEKDQLEEKFSDNEFKDALRESLGLTKDNELDTVKANILKDLEESHTKQLEEFKKSTAESVNALHKAAAAQNNQLIFIANLHKNNKEMREMIEELAEAKREQNRDPNAPPESGLVRIGMKDDGMRLSGISLSDLSLIKSLTGREINPDGSGGFTIDFSNSIFDFMYNQDPRQNHLTDMTLMAEAVKASGYDIVTFDVDIDPHEVALERAKQAYEAAINAGFLQQVSPKPEKDGESDHIIINVNNKTMRADELFKDEPQRLRAIHAKADSIKKELEDLKNFKPRVLDTSSARTKMEQLREKIKEKRLLAQEEHEEKEDTSLTRQSQRQ